jgi:hypothetical protein
MNQAPLRCRVLKPRDDLSQLQLALEQLPGHPEHLSSSDGLLHSLMASGDALFPGLRWVLFDYDAGPAAAVPVQYIRESNSPLRLISLRSLSRFEMLYADARIRSDVSARAVGDGLLRISGPSERRPDVLRCRNLPRASSLYAIVDALEGSGRGITGRPGTSVIDVGDAPAKWMSSLTRNLRGQIRQAEKRLAARGAVDLRFFQTPEEIAQAFSRFLALEAAGYKRELNPLASEAGDRDVLRGALLHHSRIGEALVMELWVGDTLSASQFGIRRGGRFYLIKVAFNETLADASPGTYLMSELIRHLSATGGARAVDCCVRQRWHDRWHPLLEDRFTANIPNPGTPRGIILGASKWMRDRLSPPRVEN